MKFMKLFWAIAVVIFPFGASSTTEQRRYQEIPDQISTIDYFSVVERATPVLFRVPRNSRDPPKEMPALSFRHSLPKNLDLLLRRQNQSLRMRLHRMRDVLGSHTRVEWSHGDGMESTVLSPKCVYHGKVDGMETSLATVDLCNDMRGIIRTDFDDIYLQPIADNRVYAEGFDNDKENDFNGTHIVRIHRRRDEETVDRLRTVNLTEDTTFTQQKNNLDGEKEEEKEDNDHESMLNHRHKRQTLHRGPRFMQVLLVTDDSLVRFHGRNLIEQYLLTQMSIVDSIYHHPSLGFEINLVVVKIKFIEDSVVRQLVVRGDGKESLDRFCLWVSNEKPKNRNKDEDFDVAVYITKEEIGPAGFAPVTGMCNPMRSCALVKDDGTSSAFVIAHEIGHIFGMIHDGHGNTCSDDPSDGKIMASMVQSNYHTYYWSPCNKEAMEKYLVDTHCLDEKPKDPMWPVYTQPYGQSWSLDEQCRQEFGSGYSLCRAFDHLDPCNHLWCSHLSNNTLCKTKRGPPLPGSSCGRGKWCMNGSCLEKRSVAVDGVWSSWLKWEECSRTCGIGMQFRVRFCNQPRPKHGGRDCRGDREEFRTCNTQRCTHVTDFRAEQCAEFNEKRFDDGRRHHWQPHENKNLSEICKITCISPETKTTFVSELSAIDGTFCSYDQPNQVCAKGRCQAVGCDGILNSRQREDQCGYCGGSGTSCKRVSGHFTEPLSKKEYHRLLVVPTGARNILITERQSTPHLAHFMAVRDSKTETWYLNGNTQQEPSRHFVVHGASFTYSNKQRDGETLSARGPLLAPIDIMVYSMSSKLPPSMDYEFVVPANSVHGTIDAITEQNRLNPDASRYVWAVSGWANCSKPCGSGIRFEVFTCVDTEKRTYTDGFCSQETKPREGKQECNTHACSLYTYWWDAEDWSKAVACTSSCGSQGVQQRRVQCVTDNQGQIKAIDPTYCNQRTMPNYIQTCNRFPCTPRPPNDATITVHPSTSIEPSKPSIEKFTHAASSRASTVSLAGVSQEVRVQEVTVPSSTRNQPERETSQVTQNSQQNWTTKSLMHSTTASGEVPDPATPQISVQLTADLQERPSLKFTFDDSATTIGVPVTRVSSKSDTSLPTKTNRNRNLQIETRPPLEMESVQTMALIKQYDESDGIVFPTFETEIDLQSIGKTRQDSGGRSIDPELLVTATKPNVIPVFQPISSPVSKVHDDGTIRMNLDILDPSKNHTVAFKHHGEKAANAQEIPLPSATVRSSPAAGGSNSRASNTLGIKMNVFIEAANTAAVNADTKNSAVREYVTTKQVNTSAAVAETAVRSNGSQVDRPAKAKTTIRKLLRRPPAHQQTTEISSYQRNRFPVTTTVPSPADICLQDKSLLFCRVGANRDRCSKQTFFSLCCSSCKAHVLA